MAESPAPDNTRLVTMLILCGVAVVLAIGLYRQQVAVARLDRTDRIACAVIRADAQTRVRQARNASNSQNAQERYVDGIHRVIGLFGHPTNPQTAQQKAASKTFEDYLRAQAAVYTVTLANTAKNIVLTRKLAEPDNRLASQLHC